ncbi:hypothetical protein QP027_07755 [Corynebacterium breve]|uniref:Uncharacterized protein n=1 Tax=Corynebacterium breve TaxID=3049799 RepID=A0ABY8VBL7_9CORY|nr:hypothetical protein [Corynebacterium breve]WIM67021.1 hypothetical protein QP027_07755 [Corynebacterium breve]
MSDLYSTPNYPYGPPPQEPQAPAPEPAETPFSEPPAETHAEPPASPFAAPPAPTHATPTPVAESNPFAAGPPPASLEPSSAEEFGAEGSSSSSDADTTNKAAVIAIAVLAVLTIAALIAAAVVFFRARGGDDAPEPNPIAMSGTPTSGEEPAPSEDPSPTDAPAEGVPGVDIPDDSTGDDDGGSLIMSIDMPQNMIESMDPDVFSDGILNKSKNPPIAGQHYSLQLTIMPGVLEEDPDELFEAINEYTSNYCFSWIDVVEQESNMHNSVFKTSKACYQDTNSEEVLAVWNSIADLHGVLNNYSPFEIRSDYSGGTSYAVTPELADGAQFGTEYGHLRAPEGVQSIEVSFIDELNEFWMYEITPDGVKQTNT